MTQPPPPATQHATRNTQHVWLVARLLLVGGLGTAIIAAVLAGQAAAAVGQGTRLLDGGQYTAAQAAYEGALASGRLGGLDDPARLGLSATYLARRDPARAAAVLGPALRSPVALYRARAAVQAGRIHAWTGQAAEAIAAWKGVLVLPLQPGVDAARVERAAQWHHAEATWQAGDLGRAEGEFATLATAEAPPHDPYVVSAALRLAQLRNTHATPPDLSLSRVVHALGPPDPTLGEVPFLNLTGDDEGLPPAMWAAQLAALDGALADSLGAPDLAPASRAALWGRMWVQAEEWRAATRLLEEAVHSDPTLADAYAYLGLAYSRTDRAAQAQDALLTAVRLAPDHPLGHHLLARHYLAAGDVARAEPELQWLRAHGAEPVVTALDWATWYRLQGDYAHAEAEYLQAEQLAAGLGGNDATLNPALLLAQFYQEQATVACTQGRPAAARAVAAHPGAAEYATLGWAAHLCYDDLSAGPLLDQAATLAPRDPRTAYEQGIVLKALGQLARADIALLRAADYDPGGPWERRARAALVSP